MTNMLESESLLCDEILDMGDLKTPEKGPFQQVNSYPAQPMDESFSESMYPPTVRAMEDQGQLKDDRILQNMLRNEDKFLPQVPNYLVTVQENGISPDMRKTVADWMLEVVREQYSQPEVFCLAMNIMDRLLCLCQIHKSQLQLVGSVCVLIASKIREPCAIPGKTLITYTDYSITADELKEWELLILYKLQWELTAITSLDYLDHVLPRLGLDEISVKRQLSQIDPEELRRRTETILVLVATDYQFSYHSPSLLAASAILTALQSMSNYSESINREIKLRLQATTHTATDHLDVCVRDINIMLPSYLKALAGDAAADIDIPIPDSTSSPIKCSSVPSTPPRTCPSPPPSIRQRSASLSPQRSPEPDLHCAEDLSAEVELIEDFDHEDSCLSPITAAKSDEKSLSRSPSPLSAVDIFTEFNSNVLQPFYEQADNLDSHYSILVS